MTYFDEALTALAASVKAAGVESTTDPAVVQVPGSLVQLGGIDFDRLDGYTVQARVVLIAPDVDWPQAARVLGDLLTKALDADLVDPIGLVEPGTMPLPDNPTPLPVLTVPVLLTVNP